MLDALEAGMDLATIARRYGKDRKMLESMLARFEREGRVRRDGGGVVLIRKSKRPVAMKTGHPR